MQEIIIQVMNQFGYFGIMLLIAVENIFPPIPSEIILTFGGFMTTYSKMNTIGVITASTIGSVSGALVLYGIGRVLSPERLEWLIASKAGKLLGFKQGDINKAVDWFSKRGKGTVFFCRCIPIVRSLISIPAGIAKMQIGLFLLFTTAGSLIWNTILVNLGVFAGASWGKIAGYVDQYASVTLIVLIITAIGCAAAFLISRKISKKNKDDL